MCNVREKPSESARKKFSVNAGVAVLHAVESLSLIALDKKCVTISRSWVVEEAAVGEYN